MKKEYTKPTMQVVEITKNSGILCSSVVSVSENAYKYEGTDDEWEDL